MKTNNIETSFNFSSILNRKSSSTTTTTRWNEVFSNAQTNYSQEPNSTINSPSNLNSTNMGLISKVTEYEKYKVINDIEKKIQEQKLYSVDDVTNPFHYSKTNNYFIDDIQKEFSKTYGHWDGEAEDKTQGFAYVDKYGFSHVSSNFFRAMVYSKDGKVYNYEGEYVGGYAVDARGRTIALMGLDNVAPEKDQYIASLSGKHTSDEDTTKTNYLAYKPEASTAAVPTDNATDGTVNDPATIPTKAQKPTPSATDEPKIGYDLVDYKRLPLFQINLNYIRFLNEQKSLEKLINN